jgi:hypothetical protein
MRISGSTQHPLLFVVYPILFVYATDYGVAPAMRTVLLALVVCGSGAAALSWAAGRLMQDPAKGAIVASVFAVMFFSYGHVRNWLADPLDEFAVLGIGVGPEKVLAFFWSVVWLALWQWLRRASPAAVAAATRGCWRAGLVLVVLGVATVATAARAASQDALAVRPAASASPAGNGSGAVSRLPDIYYIILDDYARADVLKEVYGYDNGAFMSWLRSTGFYIADASRANYVQTLLSLASSLNSAYLDPAELTGGDLSDRRWRVALTGATARFLTPASQPLVHLVQYNRAARILREHGYRFVAVTSGYGGVQLPNADVAIHLGAFSDFDQSVMDTTPLVELTRLDDRLELHRRRVLYALDHVSDALAGDGPNFVFAHILSPHPPLIFAVDGTPAPMPPAARRVLLQDSVAGTADADRAVVARAYRDQVQFVTARIQRAIAAIIEHSATPPIIVLQSDHGSDMLLDWEHPSASGLAERTAILNAYYVPPAIRAKLYPRVSPVNTFRILLGHYFMGEYDLLPDESYFSTYRAPLAFVRAGGSPSIP